AGGACRGGWCPRCCPRVVGFPLVGGDGGPRLWLGRVSRVWFDGGTRLWLDGVGRVWGESRGGGTAQPCHQPPVGAGDPWHGVCQVELSHAHQLTALGQRLAPWATARLFLGDRDDPHLTSCPAQARRGLQHA